MASPRSHRETIDFQQEVARLQALLEASRKIHGALRIDDVLGCVLEIAVKEIEAAGAFFTPGESLDGAHVTSYGDVPLNPSEWTRHPSLLLYDKLGRKLTSLVVIRPGEPLSLEEQDFLEGLALQSAVCGGYRQTA